MLLVFSHIALQNHATVCCCSIIYTHLRSSFSTHLSSVLIHVCINVDKGVYAVATCKRTYPTQERTYSIQERAYSISENTFYGWTQRELVWHAANTGHPLSMLINLLLLFQHRLSVLLFLLLLIRLLNPPPILLQLAAYVYVYSCLCCLRIATWIDPICFMTIFVLFNQIVLLSYHDFVYACDCVIFIVARNRFD